MPDNGQNEWTEQMVWATMRQSPDFAKGIAHLLNIQPVLTQELNILRLIAQKIAEAAMLPNMPEAIIVPGRVYETNEQKSLRVLGEAAQMAAKWLSWMEAQGLPMAKEKRDAVSNGD